ncbi:MAG: leucine-rich repeat domain-containing protein [Clostridia bacterium]|nr:leucine-rich repeat domain-containing protein [Clostridia bacterium]
MKFKSALFVLTLTVLFVCFGVLSFAANGVSGDGLAWSIDNNGVLTISGTGPMKDYIAQSIPTWDGMISYSDAPWFDYRDSIRSVVISNGVTRIGENAFAFCNNISAVGISDTVVEIGGGAFGSGASLASINVSAGNTVFCSDDGVLFNKTHTSLITYPGAKSSTYYEVPEGTVSIEANAFGSVKYLKNLVLPSTLHVIADNTFGNCASLETVDFRGSVESIGEFAFRDCSALVSIDLSDSVLSIGRYAFYNCSSLVSADLGTSLGSLGNSCFGGCVSLQSIVIPEGITELGNSMFYGCTSLKSVYLPDSLEKLDYWAFYNCSSLVNVRMGNNITSFGNYMFYGCSSLKTIKLSDSLTDPGVGAFQYCSSLTGIELPSKLTSIKLDDFYGCTSLESITIPASVKTIDSYAFMNCTALKDVYYLSGERRWNKIAIDVGNEPLLNAELHLSAQDINLEKAGGYKVTVGDLVPEKSYVIRYATGSYNDAASVKRGTNAGFAAVSGINEYTVDLPTHGVHTIAIISGGVTELIEEIEITTSDIESAVNCSFVDLFVKVENLYGAEQVRVSKNESIILKVNPSSFIDTGLKSYAEFTVPQNGTYTITVIYKDGVSVSTNIKIKTVNALLNVNGRVFTLMEYGPGNVRYMRFAKGYWSTAAELKECSDLKTFSSKYFRDERASFAAFDESDEIGDWFTVQMMYVSGYSQILHFEVRDTRPEVTAGEGTITLTNVQCGDLYTLDWVRCAPGKLSTLYSIRHTKGSRVRKSEDIINDTVTFTDLAPGTYTLYYLYDASNLCEGMITVTVN